MFNKVKIKSKLDQDGKRWYTPHRRVFLFFWSEYFKCGKEEGGISQSMSSTKVQDAVDFIEDKAKYNRRLAAKWEALLRSP